MTSKQILCLAFSRREGGHCFAGIDRSTGLWVRPINGPQSGALYYHQCLAQTAGGGVCEPRTLDVIEMGLLAPSPKPGQPENWLIGDEPWRLAGRASATDLLSHVTNDPELFRGYEKSVSVSEVEAHPPQSSLRLVSPVNLTWFAEKDRYGKRRLRGRFSIGDAPYDLPLTDEAYTKELGDIALYKWRRHDRSVPVLLTLSLSDVWTEQMRHYKLIAGVIVRERLSR